MRGVYTQKNRILSHLASSSYDILVRVVVMASESATDKCTKALV